MYKSVCLSTDNYWLVLTHTNKMAGSAETYFSVLKVASSAEAATKHTYEVFMWRALWNDLFSQVIKVWNFTFCGYANQAYLYTLYSCCTHIDIVLVDFPCYQEIYGVAACFAACNRHRLRLDLLLLQVFRLQLLLMYTLAKSTY